VEQPPAQVPRSDLGPQVEEALVIYTWLGGPDDGTQIALPGDRREITVAYADPLGWMSLETRKPLVTRWIYPIVNGRILFYEGRKIS
jgi:hypothetical protein